MILPMWVLSGSSFPGLSEIFCNETSRRSIGENLFHPFQYRNEMTGFYQCFFLLCKPWIGLRFAINFFYDVWGEKLPFIGHNRSEIRHLKWSSGDVSLTNSIENHLIRSPFSFSKSVVIKISRRNQSWASYCQIVV